MKPGVFHRASFCSHRPSRSGLALFEQRGMNSSENRSKKLPARRANILLRLLGLFALGIIGTGLLAVPVLAGSAAYCVSEAFGWPATLEAKAPDAVGFYGIIAGATIVGLALGYTPIDPIQMLVWSAVLNGIVAVPIMAVMMAVVTRLSVMGRFNARPT